MSNVAIHIVPQMNKPVREGRGAERMGIGRMTLPHWLAIKRIVTLHFLEDIWPCATAFNESSGKTPVKSHHHSTYIMDPLSPRYQQPIIHNLVISLSLHRAFFSSNMQDIHAQKRLNINKIRRSHSPYQNILTCFLSLSTRQVTRDTCCGLVQDIKHFKLLALCKGSTMTHISSLPETST